MWEHNCMCQLSKVPSTDIQKFLSRIRSKSVSSLVLNMMKFGVGEQFSNAATLLTYHSNEKKTFVKYKCQLNCDNFQIVFKMSFTR
jgi:hypothetical protein